MKQLLLTAILVSQSIVCYSQQINGNVFYFETKKPIHFASVTLLNAKDSTLISSIYTDSLGSYKLESKQLSNLLLRVTYLGHKDLTIKIDQKELSQFSPIKAPNIYLKSSSHELSSVNITVVKPLIIRKADRFIIDTNNGALVGNNVWDILKRAPLITADDQTGLSMLGKQSAIVYINGRKNNLSGEALINYLKSLPSTAIDNLELITSPGSEYDASGNGGIINLVLKKKSTDGFQGSLTFSDVQATFNTQRLNSNLNYRNNKTGLSVSIYGNKIKQRYTENSIINFRKISSYYNENNTTRDEPKNFYGSNINFEYNINEKNTLGFIVDYGLNNQDLLFKTVSYYKNSILSQTDSVLNSFNSRKLQGHSLNINTNYHLSTTKQGESFDFGVDYLNYLQNFNQLNRTFLNTGFDLERDNNISVLPQKIINYTFSVDYSRIFKKSFKVDAGIRYFKTLADNDLYFGIINNGIETKDENRSNHFKYNESVSAIYSSLTYPLTKKIETKIGLRTEYTIINGDQIVNNYKFNRNYINLFPSGFLNYRLNDKNQLSYSLTSRINRPSFGQVNPFRLYQTPSIYAEGNPFLSPSRSYKSEFTYTLNNKYTFLINYTCTKQDFSQFPIASNDNSGLLKYQYLNYGDSRQLALVFNFNQSLFKNLLTSSVTGVFGNLHYLGIIEGISLDNSSAFAQLNLNNKITISSKRQLNGFVSYTYNSKQVTQLGFRRAYSNLDIGLRKVIKSFSLSLYITDVFKSNYSNIELEHALSNTKFSNYYDQRSLQLTINHSFGNSKIQNIKRKNSSNSEIRNRTPN